MQSMHERLSGSSYCPNAQGIGRKVGKGVGRPVGWSDSGAGVGKGVGRPVGWSDTGAGVGKGVGRPVGWSDTGAGVGKGVGRPVGVCVGRLLIAGSHPVLARFPSLPSGHS